MGKKLITIFLVVGLMLISACVSWAVPTVTSPPGAPNWWNAECQYYAYGWWEADLSPDSMEVHPPNDATHWASNFLNNTNFTAAVIQVPRSEGYEVYMSLKNVYRPDLIKEIYIYIDGTTTSNAAPMPRENGIYPYPTGTTFTGSMGGINNGDGTWRYVVSGEIHPQPSSVYLTFYVPYVQGQPIKVTNIWVGENCVPEPATVALLGLGGLALLRRKRAN